MNTINDGGSHAVPPFRGTARRESRGLKGSIRGVLNKVGMGFVGLAFVMAAAAGVLAHQTSEVRGQLERAMNLAPQLRVNIGDGNFGEAQQTFDQMHGEIAAARSTAAGPLWKAASFIPVAGPNFRAVREVAVSADDVATGAVAPLLGKYDALDWHEISPVNGRIDVTQLEEAAPTISAAANAVRLSHQRMASIDVTNLLPQIADPIHNVTVQLQGISDALGAASSASRLLPVMLGSEEPRNYLLLVQNSAEVRATGGIPGALALLKTSDGDILMGEQSSASALGAFKPPMDIDPEQEALYTARLGTQMQNVNLTPDFPTAALTAKRMWEERHSGQLVDGVLALDPVVLSHLLEATGPVDLVDPVVLDLIKDTSLPQSLTKDNVVSTLLSDVYREIEDPATQDVYFAAVASQVFAAFTNGQGDGGQLIKALTTSAQEHRLYLWSSHPDEQDIIASTAIAGAATGSEVGGASFGAYLNDGTGAKMDYYAARTVQLLQACTVGDYSRYTVRFTVTNNAPLDAGSTLPAYVTGGGAFGVEPGRIRTNYVVYGPAQSFVEAATVNGETVPLGAGKHGQRPVGTATLELGPGETAVLDVSFSRVVQDSEPRLLVTPTIAAPENVILPLIRESGCR